MPNGTEWLVTYTMQAGGRFEKTFGTRIQAEAYADELRDAGHIDIKVNQLVESNVRSL